jgi:hypothetical protein
MKSTTAELAELREVCFLRDGFACRWPGCGQEWRRGYADETLQMAHLKHRGMGGSKEANCLDNVITLCRFHHDIFDGRDGSANVKREVANMLRAQIKETI